MYFPEHNLAVEIDELGHTDRDKNCENEREKKQKDLVVKFQALILMQEILIFFLRLEE